MHIAGDETVFIAAIQTILPKCYESLKVFKEVYCKKDSGVSESFAEKMVNRINIQYRPLIIDPASLPEKKLLRPDFSAIEWGVDLVRSLTAVIPKEEVGFFGLAYNVSSVAESLPNLSSRIVHESGLKLDVPPEEKISYGCASGMLVMERALAYCREYDKAALLYIFDQCSWAANIILDRKDPEFKNSLINSMIFGDGGAGLLLIPARMRTRFDRHLPRIQAIINAFEPADTMYFNETGIQLDDKIHEKIPQLSTKHVVKPLLEQTGLTLDDIDEWSFHQGGMPILEQFSNKSILGLAEEKLSPSLAMYNKYGNLSSASAFFVFNEFFQNSEKERKGKKGIILSFGAGFYLGGVLYENE